MANPGSSGHSHQKSNPLLFTANTGSPFDEVSIPALSAPAPLPVLSSTPASGTEGQKAVQPHTAGLPPPAGPPPSVGPPPVRPPPTGPSLTGPSHAGPPPRGGGGGLVNAFRAVPRAGGRFGAGVPHPVSGASAGTGTAPVSVLSPAAPQQGPVGPAPLPDPLQPHLSGRLPQPAGPSVLAPLVSAPAVPATQTPPTVQSVFAPLAAPPPAPPPAAAASVAERSTSQTTASFPTAATPIPQTAGGATTVTSMPQTAGTQSAGRSSSAPPSHRPPSGAVPPPPKGGSATVVMRRASTRSHYAAPPGLTVATPEMTPFATPRGSIAEPGPLMVPLMASLAESDQGYEMSPAPAPVTPLVYHWFYAKATTGEPEKPPGQSGQQPGQQAGQQGQQQQQQQQPQQQGQPVEPPDWQPFSRADSAQLEREFQAGSGRLVPVLGRRYDVDVAARSLLPVYWECAPGAVRRCSWFSRGVHEAKFTPYEEQVAEKLEEIYEDSSRTGQWHRDVNLGEEGYVVLHSPGCLVHHPGITHAWEEVTMPDDPSRPRQMRRGWNMVEGAGIPADEPETVNHLVFVVHGIGSWCDLKFRKVTECVDDMRTMAAEMARSHFSGALSSGRLGRVEFLPISWHHALHGAAGGLDEALRLITLPSIPLLREFTNDTIVDVLYYTSPIFCQVILRTVGDDINSIYRKFCQRNPEFGGSVSVAGHSLGSLILFDLLSNQTGEAPEAEPSAESAADETTAASEEDRMAALLRSLGLEKHADTLREADVTDLATLRLLTDGDVDTLGLPLGARRRLLHWRDTTNNQPGVDTVTVSYDTHTGQPAMHYPQLDFKPACFFGMGSPIALFLRIRGVSQLGAEFRLPTCPRVFNIYHPFDPVSFRIEPLIDAANVRRRPVLVPHHKGRKRMHLEIKEQVVRMGTELKQRLMSSLQSTIGSVYSLGWMSATETTASVTAEMDTGDEPRIQQRLQQQQSQQQLEEPTGPVGSLNGGRRVDYVLQERPFESLNEYVFAFQSHLCYWDSEDTLLLILKEVLGESGIEADTVVRTEWLSMDSTSSDPAAEASVSAAASGGATASTTASSITSPSTSSSAVAAPAATASPAAPVISVASPAELPAAAAPPPPVAVPTPASAPPAASSGAPPPPTSGFRRS